MSARLSPDLNDEEIAMHIEQLTPEETAQLLAELLAGMEGDD